MKRIILFSTLFLCLSVICFTSCKKEKISPTQGEVITNELQSFIQKNTVTRIYMLKIGGYFPNQFSANGMVWSFSNGFIYMTYIGSPSVAYNLNYLVSYSIENVPLSNGKYEPALILYMETL